MWTSEVQQINVEFRPWGPLLLTYLLLTLCQYLVKFYSLHLLSGCAAGTWIQVAQADIWHQYLSCGKGQGEGKEGEAGGGSSGNCACWILSFLKPTCPFLSSDIWNQNRWHIATHRWLDGPYWDKQKCFFSPKISGNYCMEVIVVFFLIFDWSLLVCTDINNIAFLII